MIKDVHINYPKRPPSYLIEFRADTVHSHRASEITDTLEGVAAGKVREIAIAREVGDSVLYHSLSEVVRQRKPNDATKLKSDAVAAEHFQFVPYY